jgi:ParB/RepB/Spo0J family partition protein
MATLNQHYASKNTGTTVRKTFMVPLNELYVQPGNNVRDIDQEHVEEFRQAYAAGEFVPALAVKVTEKGVKIIDGHHRYAGALLAATDGLDLRLECKDFIGNEADEVAFMVTSSQGRPLTPLERGQAYLRLRNQGLSNTEIAAKVKRSASDIAFHIQLIECEEPVKDMVKAGEMGATTAVALQKEHGPAAGKVATELKEKAAKSGKAKVTRPGFSAAKLKQAMAIVSRANRAGDSFELDTADADALDSLIKEYLSF